MKTLFLFLIRLYQLTIRPLIGQNCRFYPSCSEYACEAIQKHGAVYGFWLALKRIFKCGPWHGGGPDPVP